MRLFVLRMVLWLAVAVPLVTVAATVNVIKGWNAVIEDQDSAFYSNASQVVFKTAGDAAEGWYRDFSAPTQMVLREGKPGTLEVRSQTFDTSTQITLTMPDGKVLTGNTCATSPVCKVFYIGASTFSSGSALLTINVSAQSNPNKYHAVNLNYYEDVPFLNSNAYLIDARNTAFRQAIETSRMNIKGDISDIDASVRETLRGLSVIDAMGSAIGTGLTATTMREVLKDSIITGAKVALDFSDSQAAMIAGAALEIADGLGNLYLTKPPNLLPALSTILTDFEKSGILLNGLWDLGGVNAAITAQFMVEGLITKFLNDGTLLDVRTDAELESIAEADVLPGLLASVDCSFISTYWSACGFTSNYDKAEFLKSYKATRALLMTKVAEHAVGNFYNDVDHDGIPNQQDADPNNPPPPKVTVRNTPPVIGTIPTQQVQAGYVYSLALVNYVTPTNTDPITGYAVASGTLPAGLTLNPATGLISGTPTTAGTVNITVTASDKDGASAPGAVQFVISAASSSSSICGQALNFSGNTLSAGWSIVTNNANGAIANERLEANITDGHIMLGFNGPIPSGTQSLTVKFTSYQPYTQWGTYTYLQFDRPDGSYSTIYLVSTGLGYGINKLAARINSSSAPNWETPEAVAVVPFDYGVYDVTLVIRETGVDVTVKSQATGLTILSQTLSANLPFTKVNRISFGQGTTTDNPSWSDNASFTCDSRSTPPVIGTIPTQQVQAGAVYSLALVNYVTPTNGDPITGYAVASGTLPAGLTLNPATGLVSGTPTTAGTVNITVTASDKDGASTPASVQFVVTPSKPVCSPTATLSTIKSGESTTLAANCTNQPTSYTWTANPSSSPLPSGSGGAVSPTVTTTYTVTATNAGGASVPQTVSATVVIPTKPVCSPTANLSTIKSGDSTTLAANCTNNPTSYTWTANPPSSPLPSGSGGAVSPTVTTTYTVTATNAGGASVPQTVSATVVIPTKPVCSPTATLSTIKSGDSTTLAANCTNQPTSYTWTANPSSSPLPNGSGGAVSPTITTTYTVTATNASGTSAPQTVSATVETSTLTLDMQAGWNLLGNSGTTAIGVETFNDASKFNTVWKWIAHTAKWAFFTPSLVGQQLVNYVNTKGYALLDSINAGEGFWVNAKISTKTTLPVTHFVTSNAFQPKLDGSNPLLPGWNLISIGDNKTPSAFNMALSTAPLAAGVVPLNLTTLWAWDGVLSKWYFYASSLESQGGSVLTNYITSKNYLDFTARSKTLAPGDGFWVNVATGATNTVGTTTTTTTISTTTPDAYCGYGQWTTRPGSSGEGHCASYGDNVQTKVLEEVNNRTDCGGFYKTLGMYSGNNLVAVHISNGNCRAAAKDFPYAPPESLDTHCQKYGGTGTYRWAYSPTIQPFGGYGTLGVACEMPVTTN